MKASTREKWIKYTALCDRYNRLQRKYSKIVDLLELKEPRTRETLDLIDDIVGFRDSLTSCWLSFKDIQHKSEDDVFFMAEFLSGIEFEFKLRGLLSRATKALGDSTDGLAGEFERLRLS